MPTKRIMWNEIDWLEGMRDEDDDDFDDKDEDGDDDGITKNTFDPDYGGSQGVIKLIGQHREPTVIPTAFGNIPLADMSNPIIDTRFFIGHLNFNLSKKVILAINNVEGVEFLKIMSRYRFLLGVGMMFMPADVMAGIEKALEIPEEAKSKVESEVNDMDFDAASDAQSAIDAVLSQVTSDSKWVAYVFPNGEHIIKVAKDDAELEAKKAQFEEMSTLSSGHIMCYND